MASSASPLDREAQSARETIVSAYASTLAASPETHGRIEASPGHCQVADERAFFSLGAERPSLGQQAHVTSSH